jgi:hypothetical protein
MHLTGPFAQTSPFTVKKAADTVQSPLDATHKVHVLMGDTVTGAPAVRGMPEVISPVSCLLRLSVFTLCLSVLTLACAGMPSPNDTSVTGDPFAAVQRPVIYPGCICVPAISAVGSRSGPVIRRPMQATLYCLVMNEYGHPVDGACVQVLDSKETAISSRLGNCSFDIYPWNVKIRLLVSKYGFFPAEVDIPVTPGRSKMSVIELQTGRARFGKKLPGSGGLPGPPESPKEKDVGKMRIIPCGIIFVPGGGAP